MTLILRFGEFNFGRQVPGSRITAIEKADFGVLYFGALYFGACLTIRQIRQCSSRQNYRYMGIRSCRFFFSC